MVRIGPRLPTPATSVAPSLAVLHGDRDMSLAVLSKTGELVAHAVAPAVPPSTSWTGRPPQRQGDADFRFFDGTTGQTVRVHQPIWKDDNYNWFAGYFILDRDGRRHDIDCWSPNAARGGAGHEKVLELLRQGRIDPRNIEVTQTHQNTLGGDGRPHWLPVARQLREDGVSMFYAMQRAQIPTSGNAWMRHGDGAAFRKGFRDARRGDALMQFNAGLQTVLGIAGMAIAPINQARQQGRGNFEIVNEGTGQRLHVSGNQRTGGVNATLYDARGNVLGQGHTVGEDFDRTVNVTPPGTSRPAEQGTTSLPVTPTGTAAITTRPSQVPPQHVIPGTSNRGAAGMKTTPTLPPGLQNATVPISGTKGTQGTQRNEQVPFRPAPPAIKDSPLPLTHGRQTFSLTLRESERQSRTEFSVRYRVGGQDHAYQLPDARTAQQARERVQQALARGGLPGISSHASLPLTLKAAGQSYRVQMHELQIGQDKTYSVSYRIHQQDYHYKLVANTLSAANAEVNQAYLDKRLPSLSKPAARTGKGQGKVVDIQSRREPGIESRSNVPTLESRREPPPVDAMVNVSASGHHTLSPSGGPSGGAWRSRLAGVDSLHEMARFVSDADAATLEDPRFVDAVIQKSRELGLWFRGTAGHDTTLPDAVFRVGLGSNPETAFRVQSVLYFTPDPSLAVRYASSRHPDQVTGHVYAVRPFLGYDGRGPYAFDPHQLPVDLGLHPASRAPRDGVVAADILGKVPAGQWFELLDKRWDVSRLSDHHYARPGSTTENNRLLAITGGAVYSQPEVRVFSQVFPDEIAFGLEIRADGRRRLIPNPDPGAMRPAGMDAPPDNELRGVATHLDRLARNLNFAQALASDNVIGSEIRKWEQAGWRLLAQPGKEVDGLYPAQKLIVVTSGFDPKGRPMASQDIHFSLRQSIKAVERIASLYERVAAERGRPSPLPPPLAVTPRVQARDAKWRTPRLTGAELAPYRALLQDGRLVRPDGTPIDTSAMRTQVGRGMGICVVTESGDFLVAPGMQILPGRGVLTETSLSGGQPVRYAGVVGTLADGSIRVVSDYSEAYEPRLAQTEAFIKWLQSQGVPLDTVNFARIYGTP